MIIMIAVIYGLKTVSPTEYYKVRQKIFKWPKAKQNTFGWTKDPAQPENILRGPTMKV